MKRFGFYITVICVLLFTTLCVNASDSVPAGLLQTIGVYDSDDMSIEQDAVITRADFIEKVTKIVRCDELYFDENSPSFTDVPVTHFYYKYILSANKAGIIYPDKYGKFYPDKPLMYNDAVVFLLRAMGYGDFIDDKGEIDYLNATLTAQVAGISLKISDTVVTWEIQTKLLLNALNAHRMGYEVLGDGSVSAYPYTLMEEYDIEYTVGIVYADDKTSLGNVKANEERIIINGESYYCTLADTMVGYNVRCYYICDDTYKEVIYLSAINNKVVDFENNDIISINGNSMAVYGKRDKNVRYSISRNASVLLNGSVTTLNQIGANTLYTATGHTYLIDNNADGLYDVCKISSYKNIYVESLNSSEKIVYGKGGLSTEVGKYENYYIYDEHNKEVEFKSINRENVLSVYEPLTYDEPLVIYISRAVPEITVSKLSSDEVITATSGAQYDISESSQISITDLVAGSDYVLYLDFYGDVVYAKETSNLLKPVYLINAREPTSTLDTCKIKVLTDTGAINIISLDETIKVRNAYGNITSMTHSILLDNFKENGKVKRQLLLIRTNDNKVKELWFPGTDANIKFHQHIVPNAKENNADWGGKGWHYLSAPRSFSSVYILDPDAIVFMVPTADSEDVKDSQFTTERTGVFVNNGAYFTNKYFPEFYTIEENALTASIVVWASNASSGGDIQTEPMIVTNIIDAFDEDTEQYGKIIQMYDFGGNEKSVFYEYTDFTKVFDANGNLISKGDIVRFEVDGDGNTKAEMIVQDYSYVNKNVNRACSNNIQYRQDYDRITTFNVKEVRNGIARSGVIANHAGNLVEIDEIFDLSGCVVFELDLTRKKITILSPMDVKENDIPIAHINGGVVRGIVYIKE